MQGGWAGIEVGVRGFGDKGRGTGWAPLAPGCTVTGTDGRRLSSGLRKDHQAAAPCRPAQTTAAQRPCSASTWVCTGAPSALRPPQRSPSHLPSPTHPHTRHPLTQPTCVCNVALSVPEGPDDRVDHKLELRLRASGRAGCAAVKRGPKDSWELSVPKRRGTASPCKPHVAAGGAGGAAERRLRLPGCALRLPSWLHPPLWRRCVAAPSHRAHGKEGGGAVVGDGAQQREELQAVLGVVLQAGRGWGRG